MRPKASKHGSPVIAAVAANVGRAVLSSGSLDRARSSLAPVVVNVALIVESLLLLSVKNWGTRLASSVSETTLDHSDGT